ncbi:uncharacterized protein [Nicotiana sylvestris]|uniref:uncharacterized protein n=1 Tax=Nicotiana sylvestris TaxID=4096 RepID=UPI00388C5111
MDPLKYIFQKLMPTGKLSKWQILLSEFGIVYVTQTMVKGQALAYHLAENSVGGEYKPLKMYFLDKEVSFVGEDITEVYDGWRMFFDGAANFKVVGIGAVLVSKTGQHYPTSAKLKFPYTTNMAEYEPYILGLNMEIDMNIQELLVIGDSDLLMHQHSDKNFIDPILVRNHNQPVYCAYVAEETDGKPCGGKLYKRTPNLGLLRCVDAKGASKLLEEIHVGTYGPHMNGFVLDKKIIRASYFWMTMETDCIQYRRMSSMQQAHLGHSPPGVEDASYKAVTKKVIVDFVKDHIVCRFGVPKSIVTYNDANLNSHLMKVVCETFKIKHKNYIAYRPQMNGAVEAANKKHQEDTKKDSKKPQTMALEATLCFEAKLSNAEWIRSRYEQLDLIDGKRMNAGPYMVNRMLTGGVLILAEIDGEVWPKPINSDAVKRYYV